MGRINQMMALLKVSLGGVKLIMNDPCLVQCRNKPANLLVGPVKVHLSLTFFIGF